MPPDESFHDFSLDDFSGDDFANDRQIQEKRRLEAIYAKMMKESVKVVTDAFKATKSSHRNLKNFLLHKTIDTPWLLESYKGTWKNRHIYFCVLEYTSSVQAGKLYYSGEDKYFAGLIDLTKTYPHTVAQPETIALKLEDIFTRTDIDFDHAKKFSRSFHVVSKDKFALEILLFNKDLDRIAATPLAEFELNEKACYFRASRRPVSVEEAENFVELVKSLLEVFS